MRDRKFIHLSSSTASIDEYGCHLSPMCYCEGNCDCEVYLSKEDLEELIEEIKRYADNGRSVIGNTTVSDTVILGVRVPVSHPGEFIPP